MIEPTSTAGLRLSKYEGAGNDFLVHFETPTEPVASPELARALCDRHRGVGADGLLSLRPGGGAGRIAMRLLNADGSQAETSGNGLRCAMLAAFDHGLVDRDTVLIETLAGESLAEILERPATGDAVVRVEMGTITVTKTASPLAGADAFDVDAGNPHLVLLADAPPEIDLALFGEEQCNAVAGGRNVEVVVQARTDELDLEVYERGVGLTDACGTGSCAAAAAARAIGRVGDRVVVHNPGGPLTVELEGEHLAPRARLSGPVRRVAEVSVKLQDFGLGDTPTR
jgi:diaminopimelate epimerase